MALDPEIDALYERPPDEFVQARNELAAALRDRGEREAASEVKALRKPTVIAWALNQLVRRDRADLDELLAAGDALRDAQRRALSGVEPREFREAMERRRRLIQSLTRRAAEVLSEAGRPSQAAEDEIGRTLEAASSDPEAGRALVAGRLEKPITTATGFDAVGGFSVVTAPSSQQREAERKAAATAVRNAERQAEKAEADARRARMRADTLTAEVEELERRSEVARREAEELEEAARAARKRLEDLRGG